MRRGLTMVELLLAVSLLTPITLAIAAWTQVAARASASAAEPMRWQAAASAVLQLIHDDLIIGDFAEGPTDRSSQQSHVEVVDGALHIRTRTVGSEVIIGPSLHRYILDAFSGQLRLGQQTLDGKLSTRPLLDRVQEWQCIIDEEQDLLIATITSRDGSVVTRSYLLP